jgi:hypothetical protein
MEETILDVGEVVKLNRQEVKELGLKESIILYIIDKYKNDYGIDIDIDTLNIEAETFTIKTTRNLINKLNKNGVIEILKMDPEEMKNILANKNFTNKGIGTKICQWCNCKTILVHEHHYPIPKRLNGTETVKICPSCHYEYHHLQTISIIRRIS